MACSLRAMINRKTPRVLLLTIVSLLGATACSNSAEPEATSVTEGGEAAGPAAYNVTFSNITADLESCFYFSGPGTLGRDNQLGDSATYDGSSLRFAGDLVFIQDSSGALVRVANHEYEGTWMTRETITLSPQADHFMGTYHYDEFGDGGTTPSQCHIDARIELAP